MLLACLHGLAVYCVIKAPAHPPDIYFMPTSSSVVDEMLKLAQVTAGDVVYDNLDSGDGRIVVLAAQNYGVRAVILRRRTTIRPSPDPRSYTTSPAVTCASFSISSTTDDQVGVK